MPAEMRFPKGNSNIRINKYEFNNKRSGKLSFRKFNIEVCSK